MIGTIVVSKTGEPMNVGGKRKLETTDPGTLQFPPGHICLEHDQEEQKPWTYSAPFQLDESRSTLVVDLGNALPVQYENIPIDFGPLWFGAFDDESVQIFRNPIPYLDESMWNQGGIFEQTVDSDTLNLLKTSKLVVVVESTATAPGSHVYPIRGAFPSLGCELFCSRTGILNVTPFQGNWPAYLKCESYKTRAVCRLCYLSSQYSTKRKDCLALGTLHCNFSITNRLPNTSRGESYH